MKHKVKVIKLKCSHCGQIIVPREDIENLKEKTCTRCRQTGKFKILDDDDDEVGE